MYNHPDRTLDNALETFDAAIILEVKNGAPHHAYGHAARQVRNGIDYIFHESRVERFVIGGIFYVGHAAPGRVPSGLDFLLNAPNYDGNPSILLDALSHVLRDDSVDDSVHNLLQMMRHYSETDKMPLRSFFNVHQPGYWRRIREFFPAYRNGTNFMSDTAHARARLAEEYVAALFREALPRTCIAVRYPFTYRSCPSDIDVLIGTDASAVIPSFQELSALGITSEISSDLRKKIKISQRRAH